AAQIPQRIIIDGGEVLIPLKQQQPGDAITPQIYVPKDGVAAAQIPQRVIIDSAEVLIPLKQQQPGDAVTPQMSATKEGSVAATLIDQGSPKRIATDGGDVLTPRDSIKDSAAVAAQTTTKDTAITPHSSPKSEPVTTVLNVNNDQKALLLKIKNILQDDKMVEALKNSPAKRDELVGVVDKFIKNIEFYQVSSRANDMVSTYLPFLWNELRDGELLFKKNKYHAKKSFTCDINLDLDRLGKISASVTAADGGFFVSFNVEKDNTKQLIMENKGELEKRFAANGLTLKVINVGQKTRLDFAENNDKKRTPSGGLDLRI
ncbi:MAG: flagellar hook-length control protein FliK, partial [Nitrospirae bacterium]|nr:flagellar hook-length control protein FliK [Nitrospirota bacterium]